MVRRAVFSWQAGRLTNRSEDYFRMRGESVIDRASRPRGRLLKEQQLVLISSSLPSSQVAYLYCPLGAVLARSDSVSWSLRELATTNKTTKFARSLAERNQRRSSTCLSAIKRAIEQNGKERTRT